MPSLKDSIDYEVVRRYFDDAADGASVAASYMAHGQDLPHGAVRYRFEVERQTIADWLDAVPKSATVLDVGCGAGAWTRIFADRYARVIGIEGSSSMVEAARQQTRNAPNVEILAGDVRFDLPDRKFQLAFLGGLCMYLNDDDVVALLSDLKHRVGGTGAIVLRESTVPRKRRAATGELSGGVPHRRGLPQTVRAGGFFAPRDAAQLRLHEYGDCHRAGRRPSKVAFVPPTPI